ncbi:MAG TPA: AAA family ATPase [Mycobacteriales bacterium]|nr:AAA family ATPase [Mycobacteriales bacterium]
MLNGAPGSGKSTLAQRYVDEHPPALNVDLDVLRSLVGGWREDPHTAGLLARRSALAMVSGHAGAGHDVVIPQYLGRVEFIEQVERVVGSVGARFVEVVLLGPKDESRARFEERAGSPDPLHRHAAADVTAAGGAAAFDEMYDALLRVIDARPKIRVLPSMAGDVDGAYRSLLAAIDS